MYILVNNRYVVEQRLGSGSFGVVHLGVDTNTNRRVAIKLEPNNAKRKVLSHEHSIYKSIYKKKSCVPMVHWFGKEGDFNVMVMDALGPNLNQLFEHCDYRLSLKSILMIGFQALDRLKYLHNKGIVHRDLKPENFLTGVKNNRHVIYLIDYGLSKRLEQTKSRENERNPNLCRIIGTARYCSINSHTYKELTRRDDIESLSYILIYFMRDGSLPWQNIRIPGQPIISRDKRYKAIYQKKKSIPINELCRGFQGSKEMINFVKYARSLSFNEEPNYRYLKELLLKIYKTHCAGNIDWVFDWTDKI